jgi:N-carbamoyl-L-amino-acid hydrolase
MTTTPLKINAKRFHHMVDTMKTFGALPQGGITRRALSEEDRAGRAWLSGFARSQGLHVWTDPAANLHFSLDDRPACESQAVIMTGSHIDSVPEGGYLDGTYGVLAGIEALLSIRDAGITLSRPLEVVAFTDEEGRFGGMLGSQALTGLLDCEAARSFEDDQGVRLADVAPGFDIDMNRLADCARDMSKIAGYAELHIEQGPRLLEEQAEIGVVTGICGLYKLRIQFRGEASHAGTTPMHLRKDALTGMTRLHTRLPALIGAAPEVPAVATIGFVAVEPGAANVIPDCVTFTLDLRHLDLDALRQNRVAIETLVQTIARENRLEAQCDILSHFEPLPCNPDIQDAVAASASNRGIAAIRMPSGAAHDALNFRATGNVGMIFVPSEGGLSHNTKEFTKPEHLEQGVAVLADTLLAMANGASS